MRRVHTALKDTHFNLTAERRLFTYKRYFKIYRTPFYIYYLNAAVQMEVPK